MKKLVSMFLAAALIMLTALTLTGCDKDSVTVTSELKISPSFRGSRLVTVKYPLSADIDAIKDKIIADDPTVDLERVTFTYKGVEEDGYYFELQFIFSDKEEYEQEVTDVIGRFATSFLSRKDTVLTKGTRMTENFDTADLIAWIVRANDSDSSTKGIGFDYSANTVTVGDETYSTGSTIDINNVQGSTVNAIALYTTNDKDGHFSRTFEFSVPNQDYIAAKDDIESYFRANTAEAAKYSGWTADGTSMLYRVIYEDMTLRALAEYTSMLLDTDNVSIFYGDRDNNSTPLSEGLAYEENLDTFSFIGPDKGAPTLRYSYSLPTSTNHGDGAIFTDGKWVTAGAWEEGVYKAEFGTGSVQLKIPDGIQYSVSGIDFTLESLGDERFRRTTSFLYPKKDGSKAMDYAAAFFTGKGANATTGEDGDNLVCSVICEGTTTELTSELVRLFGSGNFVAYRKNSSALSLTTKSTFTDYINISTILNPANASKPIRYFFSSSGAEQIVSVSVDGSETAYTSKEESYLTLDGGTATVEYYGSIPITSHIVIYVVVGLILLGITIFIAYALLHFRKPGLNAGAQKIMDAVGIGADDVDDGALALSQTTTFSIAELGALSRNKRYVDEINKDIEDRIEQDRLTERKKEIRRKELEEMERKVYGAEEKPSLEDVPELNIDALRIPAEEADEEPAEQPEPAPEKTAKQPEAAPADPFSLLDETEDEDDDL